jgi:hypothetical protein
MRKQIFVLLLIVAGMVACNKSETNSSAVNQTINSSDVPTSITIYVSENYPDATIVSTIKTSDLPTSYLMTLSTAEQISFDQRGNRSDDGHHHFGDGDSVCHQHGGGIPVDSIPALITDYITANYAAYTIRHAKYDTLCQFGNVIAVIVSQDTLQPLKLIFDETFAFVATANRIQSTDIPVLVTDFITANYADYTLRRKAELFTLADNSLQYKAFLHADSLGFSVVVGADGVLICEGEVHVGGGHHGGGDGHNGGGHHGGGHHGGGDHGNGIPVDSLSVAVTDYIAANYAAYTIKSANYDSTCQFGNVIEVKLDGESHAHVNLLFDALDSFLAAKSMINAIDLPAVITDAIAVSYADYTLAEKATLLTLADGSFQYKVDLMKHHANLKVVFLADATVVCEE